MSVSVDPMLGCISYNLFCHMSRFQGATWSLKTGHQVTHLAIERELVEAIKIGHLSRGYSENPPAVMEERLAAAGEAGCFLDVFVERYFKIQGFSESVEAREAGSAFRMREG